MKMFTVEVLSNMPVNNGDGEYSEMYKATNVIGECAAKDRDFLKYPWSKIKYMYILKSVKGIVAKTGHDAIRKFQKWEKGEGALN